MGGGHRCDRRTQPKQKGAFTSLVGLEREPLGRLGGVSLGVRQSTGLSRGREDQPEERGTRSKSLLKRIGLKKETVLERVGKDSESRDNSFVSSAFFSHSKEFWRDWDTGSWGGQIICHHVGTKNLTPSSARFLRDREKIGNYVGARGRKGR